MKQSKLFGKTTKGNIDSGKFISNDLLVRGGFIRESVAGRYFMLPLGWRVHDKIKKIIKEEMDATGAQEMISPVLHPLELWKETNRTNTAGFELMKVKDRRDAEFALGGTAEEMFVDVVRKFQLSYRDLPFNIYQFSTKFRDELRTRGGLLRVREFVMKDAYSFHATKEDFEREYEVMSQVYKNVFERVGLTTQKVLADNGYIGGEYCHEYQVEHPEGEGRFFVSEDGEYITHEDVATFEVEIQNPNDQIQEYKEIDAVRGKTMEDGQKLHGLPSWQQMKDVMFTDKNGKLYLAIIRGDLDVNKTKLEHVLDMVGQLEAATEEQILAIGSYPGFIAPVGLEDKVTIVADTSIRTVTNFYGGANKKHRDALNINIDRDFKAHLEGDIAMAQDGFQSKDGHGVLHEKRGIEVGNIFQLGYHYTTLMKDATFTDSDGTQKPYYMGCYGIGLGRTLAAVVEQYHDEKGILWPKSIAPFDVHLIELRTLDKELRTKKIYDALTKAGIEVLWDDRDIRAGEKFADSDLIGIPVRLVISEKTGDMVEWKERGKSETEILTVEEVLQRSQQQIKD